MAFNQADQYFEQATDTNGNFGNSVAGQTNSFFLPKVYSKQVLNFFRKASVVEAITNTDYAARLLLSVIVYGLLKSLRSLFISMSVALM